jgi:hypothetical protein
MQGLNKVLGFYGVHKRIILKESRTTNPSPPDVRMSKNWLCIYLEELQAAAHQS